MRSRRPIPWSSVPLAVIALTFVAACGSSPTAPAPVLATETLTGTVPLLGFSSKNFTVSYAQGVSSASVTVTALTTVAGNTPVTHTIGVAFGSVAFDGSCLQSAAYTAAAATIGQELVASDAFSAGTYCLKVYDAGTLTEAVNYTVSVKHY